MDITTGNIMLVGSILLFGSILAGKAGGRFGIPALLLFLALGLMVGEGGLLGARGIHFDNIADVQFIGAMALSVILFTGGMETKYTEIKPILGQGVVLATVGVLLTAAITGVFIYYVTGEFLLLESFLLAAMMSSTDSAAVFSILRRNKMGLTQQLRPMLELESGSNDPMAYMLTILLISVISGGGQVGAGHAVGMFFFQMGVGAAVGFGIGKMAVWVINKLHLDNHSLYSVVLLAFVFFIFSFTDAIKGNGYLAAYIAGIVMGNAKLLYKRSLINFFDGFTWLFEIVLFLSLGLLVRPAHIVPVLGAGVLIALFMMFFARPLATFVSLAPFRGTTYKGKLFVSWVGLRGAVPLIFACYPIEAGLPGADMMFNIVFVVTVASLLIQGMTVPRVANMLHLATEVRTPAFGVDLPDKIRSGLSEIEVKPVLLAHGDHLRDLILPDNTLVMMIRRGDNYFVPKGSTKLAAGDKLLVISDNDDELRRTYDSMGVIKSLR
jgi:cell volume regulation protein A